MGARQKLSQSLWLSAKETEFLALPPNPRFCVLRSESRAFQFDPNGGYGGHSERHQGAEGTLVLSERSPPSRTKLPRSACPTCAERRGNHRVRSQSDPPQFTACALPFAEFVLARFGSTKQLAPLDPLTEVRARAGREGLESGFEVSDRPVWRPWLFCRRSVRGTFGSARTHQACDRPCFP